MMKNTGKRKRIPDSGPPHLDTTRRGSVGFGMRRVKDPLAE
jgi:hypothetical protein